MTVSIVVDWLCALWWTGCVDMKLCIVVDWLCGHDSEHCGRLAVWTWQWTVISICIYHCLHNCFTYFCLKKYSIGIYPGACATCSLFNLRFHFVFFSGWGAWIRMQPKPLNRFSCVVHQKNQPEPRRCLWRLKKIYPQNGIKKPFTCISYLLSWLPIFAIVLLAFVVLLLEKSSIMRIWRRVLPWRVRNMFIVHPLISFFGGWGSWIRVHPKPLNRFSCIIHQKNQPGQWCLWLVKKISPQNGKKKLSSAFQWGTDWNASNFWNCEAYLHQIWYVASVAQPQQGSILKKPKNRQTHDGRRRHLEYIYIF